MNMKFKLGKVVIPVTAEKNIGIEGFEIEVTDYNLKEGLEVAKSLPAIMRQMAQLQQEVAEKHIPKEDELGADFEEFLTAAIAAKQTSPETFFAGLENAYGAPSLTDLLKAAISAKAEHGNPFLSGLNGDMLMFMKKDK